MKYMLIYSLTFMAIVLPVIFFQFVSDRNVKVRKHEDRDVPTLFRWTKTFSDFFEYLGFGTLLRKNFVEHSGKLQRNLSLAGLKFSVSRIYCTQFFLAIVGVLAAGGIATLLVDEENQISIPVVAVIAAVIGWAIPGVVVGNTAQKRQTEILQAIPYSIDLVASAMRGGLDFSAAIRFYVNLGIKSPLSDEYSQMLREMELGVMRTTALQNMADRIQIKEFTSFVAAIILGTELGAPLTETMEIQGEEMRKARFAIAECKAQRAPSLMILPMALFILPAVFIIILTPVFLKMQEAGVPLF